MEPASRKTELSLRVITGMILFVNLPSMVKRRLLYKGVPHSMKGIIKQGQTGQSGDRAIGVGGGVVVQKSISFRQFLKQKTIDFRNIAVPQYR